MTAESNGYKIIYFTNRWLLKEMATKWHIILNNDCIKKLAYAELRISNYAECK